MKNRKQENKDKKEAEYGILKEKYESFSGQWGRKNFRWADQPGIVELEQIKPIL